MCIQATLFCAAGGSRKFESLGRKIPSFIAIHLKCRNVLGAWKSKKIVVI
jgi:hypothetical protein